MKFKIDENLPIEIAELLNRRGYHAMTVIEEELGGEKDTTIASICLKEQRTLITLDVDFADIRTYPPHQYPGILVMRLKRQDKPYLLSFFTGLESASRRTHNWALVDCR